VRHREFLGAWRQKPDERPLVRNLGQRGSNRPCGRAAEKRNELPAPHSITSSALIRRCTGDHRRSLMWPQQGALVAILHGAAAKVGRKTAGLAFRAEPVCGPSIKGADVWKWALLGLGQLA
jgi:hypothetical protein